MPRPLGRKRTGSSPRSARSAGEQHANNEVGFYLMPYAQAHDLSFRATITKFLEEIIGVIPHDLGFGCGS